VYLKPASDDITMHDDIMKASKKRVLFAIPTIIQAVVVVDDSVPSKIHLIASLLFCVSHPRRVQTAAIFVFSCEREERKRNK
jgi:hypothetical protein